MPEPESTAEPDEITGWALAARSGDRTATAAFVRATQHTVHRFVTHLVDAGRADDLTQEVYLRAMRALPGYTARPGALPWLLSIALRTCAEHTRGHAQDAAPRPDGVAVEGATVEGATDGSATAADARAEIAIVDLVRRLSPERREAFVVTQVAGLRYTDAADVCGCPPATVRSRVAQARADLVNAMTAVRPDRLLRPTS